MSARSMRRKLACVALTGVVLAMSAHVARADEEAGHCVHHEPPPEAAPLPGQSLYNLKAQLVDQHGHALTLTSLRGQPVLIAMFYSSCTSVCPMLIGKLRHAESLLPEPLRAQTKVLLVSLDPARDTPAKLLALAKQHGVDTKRWSFTRAREEDLRKIAALLGIRYKRHDDGEISHSPVIGVLDRDGQLAARIEGTAGDPGALAAAVTSAAKAPAPAAPKTKTKTAQ